MVVANFRLFKSLKKKGALHKDTGKTSHFKAFLNLISLYPEIAYVKV